MSDYLLNLLILYLDVFEFLIVELIFVVILLFDEETLAVFWTFILLGEFCVFEGFDSCLFTSVFSLFEEFW